MVLCAISGVTRTVTSTCPTLTGMAQTETSTSIGSGATGIRTGVSPRESTFIKIFLPTSEHLTNFTEFETDILILLMGDELRLPGN